MTTLTSTGFTRTRLDERVTQIEEIFRGIFGDSINLDPSSPDGQLIGTLAESFSNLDQLAEDLYLSGSPQSARGVMLARIVQYNGIKQIAGRYSLVPVRLIGTTGTTIDAGALVKSTVTGVQFKTLETVTIPDAGQIDTTAQATSFGALIAPAGANQKIETPVYGWQSVTFLTDAVPGRAQETDEELTIRRQDSTSTPAQAIVDSLRGALQNLPSVLQAEVYENYEDETDINGIPAHSVYAIVDGGSEDEILQTIWLRKGTGAGTHGSSSGIAYDSKGNPHMLNYGRPDITEIYVIVNLRRKSGWPTDGADQIKQALATYSTKNLKIGNEVIWARLFDPINSVPGHSVETMYIGETVGPTLEANVTVPFDGKARIQTANVVVNILS